VARLRQRCHEDTEAGDAHPPAEVEVIVVAGQTFVEQARSLPRVPRHEHRARRDVEHLEDAVVLPLVHLAVDERRVRVPERVRRATDLAQDARVVPVDHLRAHDADALDALDALGGLEHPGDGIGSERRVVVDDQQVVSRIRHREVDRRADRLGQPRVLGDRQDARRSERLLEQLRRTVVGRHVDRDDRHPRMRLLRERLQTVAQPRDPVADDEHREHGRGSDRVRR
jgi:hypothetical protein